MFCGRHIVEHYLNPIFLNDFASFFAATKQNLICGFYGTKISYITLSDLLY